MKIDLSDGIRVRLSGDTKINAAGGYGTVEQLQIYEAGRDNVVYIDGKPEQFRKLLDDLAAAFHCEIVAQVSSR